MTVSFCLYKAAGDRMDLIHDDRCEFSLSNANAADVLDALGVEPSFSAQAWPLHRFRD